MSRKGSNGKIFEVTTSELSEILNLTTRRIQQLTQEDALVRVSRGKYDLAASIKSYIEYSSEKPEEELSKYDEEAKWTKARREKAELELQIMRGEVHRSDDVRRVMYNMLGAFKAKLLSLPSKAAGQLQGQTDFNKISGILKDRVYEALNELSEYDPHVFYAESKDNLAIDDEDEDVEALEESQGDGKAKEE